MAAVSTYSHPEGAAGIGKETKNLPQTSDISSPTDCTYHVTETNPVTYESSREVDGEIFLYYQGLVRNMQLDEEQRREELIKPNIDYTYATRYSDNPTKYDREKMWEIYTGKRMISSRFTIPGRVIRLGGENQEDKELPPDVQPTDETEGDRAPSRSASHSVENEVQKSSDAVSTDEKKTDVPETEVVQKSTAPDPLPETGDGQTDKATEVGPEVDNKEQVEKTVGFADEEKHDNQESDGPTEREATIESGGKAKKKKLKSLRPVTFNMPDSPGFPTTPKGNTLPPLTDSNPRDHGVHGRSARSRIRYERPDYDSSFPLFEYERNPNIISIYNKAHDYSHIRSKIDTNLSPDRKPRKYDHPEKEKLFVKRTPLNPLDPSRLPHTYNRDNADRERHRYGMPEYGRSASLDPGLIRHNNFQIPKYPKPNYNIRRDRSPYWNNMYYPKGAPPLPRRRNLSCPGRITTVRPDPHFSSRTDQHGYPDRHHKRHALPEYINKVPVHWTY